MNTFLRATSYVALQDPISAPQCTPTHSRNWGVSLMRFTGKTLYEYVVVSRKFFLAVFILSAISVAGRLSHRNPPGLQVVLLLGLVVIAWAGWTAVRKHGFSLVETGLVGFVLSFASHWTLPIFHSLTEILYLFAMNSIIFIAIATLVGFLAKKTRTSQFRGQTAKRASREDE